MAETQQTQNEFVAQSQAQRAGLVKELLSFLAHNKKWWLLPIFIVVLLLAILAIVGGTSIAPFIYTLW
jgi:Family of unknown function (DUF5989)